MPAPHCGCGVRGESRRGRSGEPRGRSGEKVAGAPTLLRPLQGRLPAVPVAPGAGWAPRGGDPGAAPAGRPALPCPRPGPGGWGDAPPFQSQPSEWQSLPSPEGGTSTRPPQTLGRRGSRSLWTPYPPLRAPPRLRRPRPRPGKGPPPVPRTPARAHTHTHPRASASRTPSKAESVPGPAVLRDVGEASAIPSRRPRGLLSPPAAAAPLFPRSRREARGGRGGGGEKPWGGRGRPGSTRDGPAPRPSDRAPASPIGPAGRRLPTPATTTSGSPALRPLLSNRVGLLSGSAFKHVHPRFLGDVRRGAVSTRGLLFGTAPCV